MNASDDAYRTELQAVIAALGGIPQQASIRGDHTARFVFAESHGRAVELSRCGDGVWVEFWERGLDSPHHEASYDSYQSAVREVSRWLRPDHTD